MTAFLQLDGWRPIRTDPVSDKRRGKGFGEVGMCDYLYLRYRDQACAAAQVLWIEFKRPGEASKPHQERWQILEAKRGARVLEVDSIDDFRRWYSSSGFNQRNPALLR